MINPNGPILIFDNARVKNNESSFSHLGGNLYSKYPFKTVGNTKVFFHGVLYNKAELLLEHNLMQIDEAEMIGILFNKFGDRVADLLDGTFCVVIIKDDSIIMFRDYFGVEPLYYSISNFNGLIISNRISDIKSLAKLEFNTEFLPYYFLNDDPTNWKTIYKGIFLVPVYEVVKYKQRENKFYFDFIGDSPFAPSQEISEKRSKIISSVESKLEKRVYHLLDSIVSIYTMLSGGIDSTLLSVILKKKGLINSLSASFEKVGGDEQYARDVAEYLNLNHKNISINEDVFFEGIIEALKRSEQPYAYKGESFFFNLFRNVSANDHSVQLLINGTGADGIFSCGRELKILRIMELFPYQVQFYAKFNHYNNNLLRSLLEVNKGGQFSRELMYMYFGVGTVKLGEVKKILGLSSLPELFSRELNLINQHQSSLVDKISKLHAYYSQIRIPNVLNTIAKSFNIRIVYPFLFKDLFRYILSLPMSERVTFTVKKYHLRKLLARDLPQKIIKRKKLNMEVPFTEMFNHNKKFKSLIEDIKDAKYDFLNVDFKKAFSSPENISFALKLINLHLINEKIIKGR